jgi:hypothetical protein
MEQLSPEEAAERIEGVPLPAPEFNAEGSTDEAPVPEADAVEEGTETTENPEAEATS